MTAKPTRAGLILLLTLAGCTTAPLHAPSTGHVAADAAPPAAGGRIPAPVQIAPAAPKPRATEKAETYSVVVNNVRVSDLLFALARDARLNVDIHPGIGGTVTLNAIDQTLPQLLSRIAKQADMRYELDGPNLVVMPDSPYLRNYKVDYVNMNRDMTGSVAINTQITSTGSSVAGTAGQSTASGSGSNSSTTEVKNSARNRFWETIEKNLRDLLRETDKILPEGSSETVVERADVQAATGTATPPPAGGASARTTPQSLAGSPNPAILENNATMLVRRTTFREAASVIANPETGVVTVRATSRQHEKVQEFLDQVMASAKRQVMIEATIAEVLLSDGYEQGIDWQFLRDQGSQVAIGQGTRTQRIDPRTGEFLPVVSDLFTAVSDTIFTAAFRNGGFTAVVRLLETFGNVKVISSPKLSVLNNQTALLKVVDNRVFFNVEATQPVVTTGGAVVPQTVTATANTVAVGLVMSVTPQISDGDSITLNVRPTITRVVREVPDPTPALALAGVQNLVPEIQTREMESVMRVGNGDIAVLGGLMEDGINYRTDAVPVLGRLPFVGNFFTYRNDTNRKSELVIFLRPVVVRQASIEGDYRSLRDKLPDAGYFRQEVGTPRPVFDLGGSPAP